MVRPIIRGKSYVGETSKSMKVPGVGAISDVDRESDIAQSGLWHVFNGQPWRRFIQPIHRGNRQAWICLANAHLKVDNPALKGGNSDAQSAIANSRCSA